MTLKLSPGCTCCDCCRNGTVPQEYDISFSGFTDSECDACEELDGTFSASFIGYNTPSGCIRDLFTPYNCCRWRYSFDDIPTCDFYTEMPGSTVNSLHVYVYFYYIDLTARELGTGGTIWELEILANVIVWWADSSGVNISEEGRALCRLVWTLNDASWRPDCDLDGSETWSIISGCTQYFGDSSSSLWAIHYFSLDLLCDGIGTPTVEAA